MDTQLPNVGTFLLLETIIEGHRRDDQKSSSLLEETE